MGPFGGYSEAIPNGKLFRSQSEWKGRAERMALPSGTLFHVFTVLKTPNRMVAIWLDLDEFMIFDKSK